MTDNFDLEQIIDNILEITGSAKLAAEFVQRLTTGCPRTLEAARLLHEIDIDMADLVDLAD